ncbi:hypothetical protein [Paenibacillus agricola]|uniref:YgiT-type zinc finger domain-containing protein n=1 Tax=Paenibacillus agricola TaxID=2716264 RepID=A0ABX0JBJ6_9BACL|nr:hypothetical protein [Paenibacillus agricola]NHN33323.1 hypothetical protein [Paenibacillus agricola]
MIIERLIKWFQRITSVHEVILNSDNNLIEAKIEHREEIPEDIHIEEVNLAYSEITIEDEVFLTKDEMLAAMEEAYQLELEMDIDYQQEASFEEPFQNIKSTRSMHLEIAIYPNQMRELLNSSRFCCDRLEEKQSDRNYSLNILENCEISTIPRFVKQGLPVETCPFCKSDLFADGEYTLTYVYDPLKLAESLSIGDCDVCNQDNRIVNYLHDEFGFHVLNTCKFGCDDVCSDPSWLDGNLTFNVISLTRVEQGHMDSRWQLKLQDSNSNQIEKCIIRRDTETAEELLNEIHSCTAHHQLSRLDLKHKIYYD